MLQIQYIIYTITKMKSITNVHYYNMNCGVGHHERHERINKS